MYHPYSFTTNPLGCQSTSSQYFHPFALQSFDLAAAAIHCTLAEYASGKQATVMFSQAEYQGTCCPSPVINFTLEAIALKNHTLVGCLTPPLQRIPDIIGTPQFCSVLIRIDLSSSLSVGSQFLFLLHSSVRIGPP